jgi:hypothetical protein
MSIRIVVVTFLLSIEGACGRKRPVDRKVTSPSSCRANLPLFGGAVFCICIAEQVTLAAEPPMLRGQASVPRPPYRNHRKIASVMLSYCRRPLLFLLKHSLLDERVIAVRPTDKASVSSQLFRIL